MDKFCVTIQGEVQTKQDWRHKNVFDGAIVLMS